MMMMMMLHHGSKAAISSMMRSMRVVNPRWMSFDSKSSITFREDVFSPWTVSMY